MFNNALDHSQGQMAYVSVTRTAMTTEITILDDGIGIFKKIQNTLGLLDERHAILELTKGKLTTDPDHHTERESSLPRACSIRSTFSLAGCSIRTR